MNLTTSIKVPNGATAPKKRRRRQPEEVKARLTTAAIKAFSRHGFAGASLRAIARDAGVTIQLLVYHFSTKEDLWKHAMAEAFSTFDDLHQASPLPDDAPVRDRMRRYIADLVEFTGKQPELLRIMIQEAGQITARMAWLADTRTAPMLSEFCALAKEGQEAGVVVADTPASRLFYAAAAIASLPFSVAAEYNYLVGSDPFTPAEMQCTTLLIERLIFVD